MPSIYECLQGDIDPYLEAFREALVDGYFEDGTETLIYSYDQMVQGVIEAVSAYDQRIRHPATTKDLTPYREQLSSVLKIVNGEVPSTPERPDYSGVLISYYTELHDALSKVVAKIQLRGFSYLMNGLVAYNEGARRDIEALSLKFQRAKNNIHPELYARNAYYREIENDVARSSRKPHANRIDEISSGIGAVHELMLPRQINKEQTARKLIHLTHLLMRYLGNNVGEGSLELTSSLDTLKGPLNQLKTMLSILTNMLEAYQDCVVRHRALLLAL